MSVISQVRAKVTPAMLFGIIAAIILISVLIYILRQPTEGDYETARTTDIATLRDSRTKVPGVVNAYLEAFKTAQNESGSKESATKDSEKQASEVADELQRGAKATESLASNRVTNTGTAAAAIRQLNDDARSEQAFYSSLVKQYPTFAFLFSDSEQSCNGVFVGDTATLTERKDKLAAAVSTCKTMLKPLAQSSNDVYEAFAADLSVKLDKLVADAKVTAETESKQKEFESQLATFQRRYDEAVARNASEDELLKLADDIKLVNADIKQAQSTFDYSANRYIRGIKELPDTYSSVFARLVPAKLKYHEQTVSGRLNVTDLLLEADAAS